MPRKSSKDRQRMCRPEDRQYVLLEGRTAGRGVSMPWKPAMVSFLPGHLLSIQARVRTLTGEVMGRERFQAPSRLCIEYRPCMEYRIFLTII